MAVTNDGTNYVCGFIKKDGSMCTSPVRVSVGADLSGVHCINHKNALANVVGGPVVGGYDSLLPPTIAQYYNEEDEKILSLKPKVALLDSFLKRKLSQLDTEGVGLRLDRLRKVLSELEICPMTPDVHERIDMIRQEVERASSQELLERDIRNLVQEITSATKQEVGQQIATGQLIPVERVVALVQQLHGIALNYAPTADAQSAITKEFYTSFQRTKAQGG